MAMTREDLEALREGWDFEAKLAAGRDGRGVVPDSFWETYSAMANSQGGRIVLGVRERADHTFETCGIANIEGVERELWNLLQNPQKVNVNVLGRADVQREDIEGQTVLVVAVPRAAREQRPVYIDGDIWNGTFIRVHEGDRHADQQRVRRMIAEAEFETRDDRILPGFGLDDLDRNTLAAYRQRFTTANPDHPWLSLNDGDFLRQLGGWRRDRQSGEEGLTAAGLLLFGRYGTIREAFPNYFVDYQARPGDADTIEWTDRIYPDDTWSGNLFDFYHLTVRRLVANLEVPFQLDPDLYRRGDTHVHEALREALVNTLIHADYEGHPAVLVVKRPDGFEFRNPGGLRLPARQIRQGGLSDCRNRTLQRMFLRIGLGEQAGSGFTRILRAWREQHWLVPTLVEDVELDTVRLGLSQASLLGDDVLTALDHRFPGEFRQLGEVERLALATTLVEGRVTNRRMQEITDRHPRDLTFMFRGLVGQGFLESFGERSGTYYVVQGGGDAGEGSPQTSAQSPERSPQTSTQREESPSQTTFLGTPGEESAVGQVAATRWSPRTLVKAAILELCQGRYRTIQEVAEALGRSPRTIQQHYVQGMVAEDALRLRHPDLHHPDQAYRVVGEDDSEREE